MADLEHMRIVIALAKAGSIAEAAAELGTSRAKVRRKLEALEEATGVQLLVRVDGVLKPTAQGKSFIEGAERVLREAALLITHTREIGTEPSGVIRLALQVGVPHMLAAALLSVQRRRFPGLRKEILVCANPVMLLPDCADMAVTLDEEQTLPEFQCTRLAALRWQLVATEAYLTEHGRPKTTADLANHALFTWRSPSGEGGFLHRSDGTRMPVEPVISCNDERYLFYLAHTARGIAYAPKPPLPDIEFPDLVTILGEEIGHTVSATLVVPKVLADIPRVRVMYDAAIEVLSAASFKPRP